VFRFHPLRPLGLTGRAGLLLAVGLALGALLTVLFFVNLAQINGAYERADAARQQLSDNQALVQAMTEEDAALDGYAATGDPALLAGFTTAQQDSENTFATLSREVKDPREVAILKALNADRGRWDAILNLRRSDPADPALSQQGHALFAALQGDDGNLQQALTADHLRAQASARASTTTAQVTALLGAGTGALALLLLARLFLTSTLAPLLALLHTAEEMAEGRISQVPGTERQDEVGALARALVAWDRTARRQGALERRAKETETRYQHLFRRAPFGVARMSADLRIEEANPALAEMLEVSPSELRQASLPALVEPVEPGRLTAPVRGRSVYTALASRVRHNGSLRWLEVVVSRLPALRGGGPAQLVAMFEDVTETQRHLERLRAINRVGQAILEGRPMAEVEAIVARNARELVDADLAAVAVVSGTDLVVRVAVGHGADRYQGSVIPIAGSLAGEAITSGVTVISDDIRSDPRAMAEIAERLDTVALAAAPIAHDGVVIAMNRTGGRRFEPADVELLGTFTAQAALAYQYQRAQEHVRQVRLLEERERIAKDLQDSVIQSLFGIGLTLQAASIRAGAGDVADRIDAAESDLDATIRRMRNLVFGLMPNMDADRHLDLALRHLAEDFALCSGVDVVTEVDQPLAAQLSAAAPALLDLTRRALRPAGWFSSGGPVQVRLHRQDGHAVLDIDSENGRGPDRLELPALRESMRGVGGEVQVRRATARRGARLRVRVPV
jgi:PAS domain S-box-containing protein